MSASKLDPRAVALVRRIMGEERWERLLPYQRSPSRKGATDADRDDPVARAVAEASMKAWRLQVVTHAAALRAEYAAEAALTMPLRIPPERWGFPVGDGAGALEVCLWRVSMAWCQCFRCLGADLWAREIVAGRPLPSWLAGAAGDGYRRAAAAALNPPSPKRGKRRAPAQLDLFGGER